MIHHRKLIQSFRYAWDGVVYSLRENQNLRVHFLVALIVAIASVLLGVSHFEMGILGVMILLVVAAEMINSAIEEMVDLITKEHREEAKIAKDVAAGMVLVVAAGSVVVGIIIFTPYVFRLWGIYL